MINRDVIRQSILQDWQSHEVSLDITLTRLRLHENIHKKDVIKAEVTTHTGWEGAVWEDLPRELQSMVDLETKTHAGANIDTTA